MSSSAARAAPSIAPVWACSRSPAGVSRTGRLPRSNSVTPSSRSSWATWWETTDWV